MTRDERQAVTAALCKLATATGGQELDADRILVYLEQLDSDPVDQVLSAIQRLTRTARFFPAVGEIVAEMNAALGEPGEQAWQALPALSRADGDQIRHAYRRDCRLEAAVRALGGIAAFRGRTLRDEPFLRARFLEAYSAADRLEQLPVPPETRRILQ